jgi:hypothetical protein
VPSCPYCFTPVDHHPTFACTGDCPLFEDKARTNATGVAHSIRGEPIRWVPPAEQRWEPPRPTVILCPRCGTMTDKEICGHCHTPLPGGWWGVHTTCVAMAGARVTGKSVYVGVLKPQLEQLLAPLRGVVGFEDEDSEQRYQEKYLRPLFESRQMPRHTAPAALDPLGPLVLTLGTIGDRRRALVIHDVAGEDLEVGRLDPAVFGFFGRADAVLFLFDPLRVDSVAAVLRGQIPPPGTRGGNPLSVLQNLIRLMKPTGGGRIQTPLAVVLSKFDALHALADNRHHELGLVMRQTGAAIRRDPSLYPAFDRAESDLLDAEVRSLLDRLDAGSVLNQVAAEFANHRYFAVSALGHPGSDDLQSSLGIAPFRCTDPIKWALAATGAIPTS